jgi:hypothetical protein
VVVVEHKRNKDMDAFAEIVDLSFVEGKNMVVDCIVERKEFDVVDY